MISINWKLEAEDAAKYVSSNMFEAHRGAIRWKGNGVTCLFGNDGYSSDERSKAEVEYIRTALDPDREIAFATGGDDGYSWAMLVRGDGPPELDDLVWSGWRSASSDSADPEGVNGYCWIQKDIASRVICEHEGDVA